MYLTVLNPRSVILNLLICEIHSKKCIAILFSDAINDLINPGGYVDRDMYFDRVHMLKLIATQ